MFPALQRILILFLLMLPCVASAVAVCDNDSTARERELDYFYLQAISLMEQDKYDAAYDMLEHCRSLAPTSSAVLFELVNMYQYLGQREKALSILKQIVEDNPQNFQFRESLVQFYENEGNEEALLQVYEDMAQAFPSKSELYLTLAMKYTERGEYSKAVSALDYYEKIEGRSDAVSFQRYQIYMMMQDRAAATKEIESLIAEFPDESRFRALLGETYLYFGDSKKALAIHNEVLAADPENVYSLKCLATYYKAEKEDSLYCHYVEQTIRNERLDSEMRGKLLTEYLLYQDGKGATDYIVAFIDSLIELPYAYDDAVGILFSYHKYRNIDEGKIVPIIDRIIKKEPDNRIAHIIKLYYALEHRKFDEIISRCDTAIMYFPETLMFYYYKGLALYNIGRKAAALDTYRQGIERGSDSASTDEVSDMYALIGDACYESGNLADAMKAYDEALAYNSNNLSVLNNYAYYLALENKELERALEMSARTLQEEPDELIYVDTYAWILFLLERYDEAKKYADKLMEGSSVKSAVEYHHCGDIYAKCGDIERAVQCWTMARDNGDESKVLKRKIKKRKYISDGKKK